MFKVDWYHFLQLLLPPHKRKTLRLAWLKVFIKPFVVIYNSLLAYREQAAYEAAITGQTIYLQKYLNDRFNNGMSGIVVVPVNPKNYVLVSTIAIGHDVPVGEIPEPDPGVGTMAYYASLPDFIIQVPTGLVYDQNSMIALVRKYAYASKNFIIQTI